MKKSKKNYLDLVPVLNPDIRLEDDGEQKVLLIENKGFFNKIAQIFFKKPPVSTVHLDKFGSFILPLIDGRLTVAELALLQKEQFGETCEPLYPRFVKYMQIMESYGFVKLKDKEDI
ncbi:MAG: PqqD family protein [Eubacterium sp.]|nr:PqqD family protein [Eubacterium sp.]